MSDSNILLSYHLRTKREEDCTTLLIFREMANVILDETSQCVRGVSMTEVNTEHTCTHLTSLLTVQEARLFGPAIFKAAKLRVLFLGADKKHPVHLPRIYNGNW